MAYVMLFVALLIIGLLAYGYGHALFLFGAVVGVLLVGFFVVAAVTGIVQGVKEKTAELRAAAEAHRAMRLEAEAQAGQHLDVTKFVLIPVDVFARWQRDNPAAAATIVTAASTTPAGETPASDEELKRLRRIAGLENGGSNE
jgi:hypothetical protein